MDKEQRCLAMRSGIKCKSEIFTIFGAFSALTMATKDDLRNRPSFCTVSGRVHVVPACCLSLALGVGLFALIYNVIHSKGTESSDAKGHDKAQRRRALLFASIDPIVNVATFFDLLEHIKGETKILHF